MKTLPLKILIVDDHSLIRRGLRDVLSEEFKGVVIGEASNHDEAISLFYAEQWDVVLLDINMPGLSGLETLIKMNRANPDVAVLILSAVSESEYALQALKAGAAGFINKRNASEELVVAIKKVLSGDTFMNSGLLGQLTMVLRTGGVAPHESLSSREFQTLRLIASGRSVKEIASDLELSEKTVATYLARIKSKTSLSNHVEMTRYAFEHKLI
jgi:DNA-binding NarL/FixJ family response regulator